MEKRLGARLYDISIALVDILLVHAGFIAVYLLHERLALFPVTVNSNDLPLVYISASSVVIFYLFDLYTDWRRKSGTHLVYLVSLALFSYNMILLIAAFWNKGMPLLQQQAFIIQAFFLQSLLLSAYRMSMWYVLRTFMGGTRVLIIYDESEDSALLGNKLLQHQKGWYTLSGFLPAGKLRQLKLHIEKVDALLISPLVHEKRKNDIMNTASTYGKEVLLVPKPYELSVTGASFQQISDMPVLSIQPCTQSFSQKCEKRLFDIAISSVLLILASPVFLVLSILIPATSTGAAFYRQERIGLNGAPFHIWKFRSMKSDAEKATGPVLAADNDPRITRIGRIIRATRLDELPQLINVLRGDMSIVGPRPERKHFISQFKREVPDYEARLAVKPGITGLAQVLGNYTTSVEDKLRFDLMYVRHSSLAFDVKILLQTVRVVLQREQAQGVQSPAGNDSAIQPVLEAKL